jgi:hypothetical protein
MLDDLSALSDALARTVRFIGPEPHTCARPFHRDLRASTWFGLGGVRDGQTTSQV